MDDIIIEVDDYLDFLNEAKRTSRSKVTRNTKIKRATGQLASIEARKRGDSAYKNMVKYRTLYFKYREIIHKKYGARVRSKARR